MKYRHAHHAGNFADVHKHVTLLALLAALKRKDKGFLYLETHAGRGAYELAASGGESAAGIGRFETWLGSHSAATAEELRHYGERVLRLRRERGEPRLYPGSPLLAVRELRPQDRAVLIEQLHPEARALEKALPHSGALAQRLRVESGDGFERLRAWLPPAERRGLTFMDPPYEETRDFVRVRQAAAEALRRFATGVVAVWYPIKDARDTAAWQSALLVDLAGELEGELLVSELSLYPSDSRVALNGSGMLIVNPPYRLAERMQVWLPQLYACLDLGHGGGAVVRSLRAGAQPGP
ncbi:MAG TPA: 23S rRNA (adenine(2030)-N(6))-methyltransferase RlmJ [Steroidobacteraceae bacterium]|nr:23S rRNA (adenine(2030)-N(6))-methyltransferase RlmJ [Steroidobacteraceae bacterium]